MQILWSLPLGVISHDCFFAAMWVKYEGGDDLALKQLNYTYSSIPVFT